MQRLWLVLVAILGMVPGSYAYMPEQLKKMHITGNHRTQADRVPIALLKDRSIWYFEGLSKSVVVAHHLTFRESF